MKRKKLTMMDVYERGKREEVCSIPKDYPAVEHLKLKYPKDITAASNKKLGRLHSRYTAFLAYVNQKLAECKYQVTRLRILRGRVRAGIVFTARGIKMKVSAAVIRDSTYQALQEESLSAQTQLEAWRNMMWTLQGYIKSVEFEEQRRGKDFKAAGHY